MVYHEITVISSGLFLSMKGIFGGIVFEKAFNREMGEGLYIIVNNFAFQKYLGLYLKVTLGVKTFRCIHEYCMHGKTL